MRIGIDIRVGDAIESGQQRYLWRLGRWLAERGDDVHLLTVKAQPEGVAAPGAAHLHALHGLSRAELREQVRRLELDVLLLNPERSRRYRGIEANLLRPGYGTEHYRQKSRSFRSALPALARRADRLAPWVHLERRWERAFYEAPEPPPDVIATSAYMKREILEDYDVPESHVHVVHNGVDLEEFSPARREGLREERRSAWGIPRDAICLLFMGHNFRLKGLWQLLDLLRRLREGGRNLHLVVAGKGTGRGQRRKAQRLTRAHGLEGAVHLVGPVRPAMNAFAAADVFVHLSWHDSFGFVTLEAMSAGLPVVTTPHVGASELIEDGVSGILVNPDDPAEIERRIGEVADAALRRRIGEQAARIASAHAEEENFREVREVMQTARERRGGPVR